MGCHCFQRAMTSQPMMAFLGVRIVRAAAELVGDDFVVE